jgi:hypothetical protein
MNFPSPQIRQSAIPQNPPLLLGRHQVRLSESASSFCSCCSSVPDLDSQLLLSADRTAILALPYVIYAITTEQGFAQNRWRA